MSHSQIERLRDFLRSEGFVEGEDFRLGASERGTDAISLSVEIPFEEFELPEELMDFEQDPDEVERAIWKGNTEKKTWSGANFELALRAYGSSILEKDPEFVAMSARIEEATDMPTLQEYEALKSTIWKRIWEEPKHAAWERELNENLF